MGMPGSDAAPNNRFVWQPGDIELITQATDAEFKEEDHKRDQQGKFSRTSQTPTQSEITDDHYKRLTAAAPKPNDAQRQALGMWSMDGYEEINAALRGSGPASAQATEWANNIAEYLDQAAFPEDTTVTRGVSADYAQTLRDLPVGAEFQDHGFASTDSYYGELTIKINVKQGAKAAAISDYSVYGETAEREILLQRGSRFRVVGKSGDTMMVDLLGPDQPAKDREFKRDQQGKFSTGARMRSLGKYGSFTPDHLTEMKSAMKQIAPNDYPKVMPLLDGLSKPQLRQIREANIPILSVLAKNRIGADRALANDRKSWKSPIWQPRPWSEDNISRDRKGKFSPSWQSPRWKSSWDAEDEHPPILATRPQERQRHPSSARQNGWNSPSWDDEALDAAEWKEHEHPRDEEGKFTEGEGTPSAPEDIPAPPQIQSKDPANLGKQKHLDKLYDLAKNGQWSQLENYPTPGVNTYAKKVQQYKAQLLGLKPSEPKAAGEIFGATPNDPAHFTGTSKEHGEFTYTGPPITGKSLNGVEFKHWDHPDNTADWDKVEGQTPLGEPMPPFAVPPGKHAAAGVLIEEPDGRVWIVKPTNAFGGYNYTFPKGTREPGMSLQATAIKEAYEESGLQVAITGFAGDFEGTTSKTRYFFAKRVGGTPEEHEWETDGVSLIPKDKLNDYLNVQRDQDIVKAHLQPGVEPKKPSVGGVEQAHATQEVKDAFVEAGFAPAKIGPDEFAKVSWENLATGMSASGFAGGAWELYDDAGKQVSTGQGGKSLKDALAGKQPTAAKPTEKPTEPAPTAAPGQVPEFTHGVLTNQGFTPTTGEFKIGEKLYQNPQGFKIGILPAYGEEPYEWTLYNTADTYLNSGKGVTSLNEALQTASDWFGWEKKPAEPTAPPTAAPTPTVKQQTLHESLSAIGYTAEPSSPSGFTLYHNPDTGIDIGFPQHPDKVEGEPGWSIFKPNGNVYASGTGQSELGSQLSQAEKDVGKKTSAPLPTEPTAPPPTAAPSKAVPIGEHLDLAGMKKTGPQQGSNPGGQYTAPDGSKRYAKFYPTDDHAKNEMLAAALFKRLGGDTLNYHPITDSEGAHGAKGKLGVSTDWATNLGATAIINFNAEQRKAAQNDFALHVWLSNWDATGSDAGGGKNLNIVDGKQTPMDFGGSLLYRAQGGAKGSAFTDDATDWDTMRDPGKNPNGAKLYGEMTNAQLKASADRLKQIRWSDVDDLVEKYGPGDNDAKVALIDKLMARKKAILAKAKALPAEPSAKPAEPPPSPKPPEHQATAEAPPAASAAVSEPPPGFFKAFAPTKNKQAMVGAGFEPAPLHLGSTTLSELQWQHPSGVKINAYSSGAWSLIDKAGQAAGSGEDLASLQKALSEHAAATPSPAQPTAEAPSAATAEPSKPLQSSYPALIGIGGGKEWFSPDGKEHRIYFKGKYQGLNFNVNTGKFGTKWGKHTAAEIDTLGKELLEQAGISLDAALDSAINSFFRVSWDSPQWIQTDTNLPKSPVGVATIDWHSPHWNDNLIEHSDDQMVTTASSGPPAFIRKRAHDMIKQLAKQVQR